MQVRVIDREGEPVGWQGTGEVDMYSQHRWKPIEWSNVGRGYMVRRRALGVEGEIYYALGWPAGAASPLYLLATGSPADDGAGLNLSMAFLLGNLAELRARIGIPL